MGTRHLTCVIQDGEFRVAQYGQWDGYPEGQGCIVLDFLKRVDLDKFCRQVRARCRWMDNDEYEQRYAELGFPADGMLTLSESEIHKGAFPYLNRDLGADILNEIYTGHGPVELRDDSAFAHDSLFCEWAYVIDLDRNLLEVYQGFNKDPDQPMGVFASVPLDAEEERRKRFYKTEYYSVKLVKTYGFSGLPTHDVFVAECSPEEEEEEE